MSTHEHGFKAEVQQLLTLMIHSVYSDREVFLRELVSNAADALDKVRFLGLTRPDLAASSHDPAGIRLVVDTDARTVRIEDDGIGMTEEEAVNNLGTIARSGTRAFLEQVQASGGAPPKLIGQFGLGFYASFMVADRVVVDTLSAEPGATPVRWTSQGAGSFSVEPGDRAARGTAITLHLREDAAEFVEPGRIEAIIKKHSDFLPWPVFVGDKQANTAKALWVEPPSKVSEEEANAFYQSVSFDWRNPALRIHVSVDSPFQYHALLFVPAQRPYDLFQPEAPRGPRLYARRVLIEEHARELLPDWLRFVRGVVDSEDIALNVSREMVQKTPIVRKLKDALTKRILKDLAAFANAPAKETPEGGEKPATYADVWKQFGALLKEGYYHSKDTLGELLLPLLRFNALDHADEDGQISLADYKAAAKDGQDAVWYLAAETRKAALHSPHLEIFRKRGYNVLLLTDPVDEFLMQVLTEYEGLPLKSVARGAIDLQDEESAEAKADLGNLAPWMKDLLADDVANVRESNRLTDSAAVLVDDEAALSANMERILRQVNQPVSASKRILELNARHPLIRNLALLKDLGKEPQAERIARLLLDDALLLEGSLKEPAAMGKRLQDLLLVASQSALDA